MDYEVQYEQKLYGSRIREIRKSAGMKQEVLAEKLMLSVDMLSKIENGKSVCMPEHITRICQLFNISADYFYFGYKRNLKQDVGIDFAISRLLESADDTKKDQIYRMIQIMMENVA